jgi:hypothetical protein
MRIPWLAVTWLLLAGGGTTTPSGAPAQPSATRLPDGAGVPTTPTERGRTATQRKPSPVLEGGSRRSTLESARGVLEIDRAPADPEIHLELYDHRRLVLNHVIKLSELASGAR